jgi:hypothetical protein
VLEAVDAGAFFVDFRYAGAHAITEALFMGKMPAMVARDEAEMNLLWRMRMSSRSIPNGA